MRDEDFWKTVQEKDFTPAGDSRTGALNLALLFGTAVIALALVLTPVLSAKTDKRMINPDSKLGAVTGKDQISMFKMTSAVNKHLS